MTDPTHPRAVAVAVILAERSPNSRVRELDESTRTAAAAAEALGCEVGAIANSLVFTADDGPVLILASGAHRVDLALVAAATGLSGLRRATPDEVLAATGQPIGGVAPIGHPHPLRTWIDEDLAQFSTVWAAAGTPRSVFDTTLDGLATITGGTVIRVA